MNDKIKKLKDLLFELDGKHSASVTDTQQNINDVSKRIVKLFATPVTVSSLPSKEQLRGTDLYIHLNTESTLNKL